MIKIGSFFLFFNFDFFFSQNSVSMSSDVDCATRNAPCGSLLYRSLYLIIVYLFLCSFFQVCLSIFSNFFNPSIRDDDRCPTMSFFDHKPDNSDPQTHKCTHGLKTEILVILIMILTNTYLFCQQILLNPINRDAEGPLEIGYLASRLH